MLADTDAGSVITASQSGAQWGYRLLLLQVLIIPVLFAAQELTVRLALSTGKGYGELILQQCGRPMAWLVTLTLCISCFGALVTEMSGLAGVGQLYGVPAWQTIVLAGGAIFAVVCTGSYRSVERVALALGAFELAFVLVAWLARPDYHQVAAQMREIPWRDHRYLYLLAANLGTSIMPWTIFYQQSALLDKGLTLAHLKTARLDTLLGAVLCQLITAAVLIAAAAAFGAHGAGMTLQSVPDIAQAFTAVLGQGAGRALFAVALSGGALVATIVVCLALAWALGEIVGLRHSQPASGAVVLRGVRCDVAGGRHSGGVASRPGAFVDCHRHRQCAGAAADPRFFVLAGALSFAAGPAHRGRLRAGGRRCVCGHGGARGVCGRGRVLGVGGVSAAVLASRRHLVVFLQVRVEVLYKRAEQTVPSRRSVGLSP
jgi:Mn2+/Fe2+ NRAMP family transporter